MSCYYKTLCCGHMYQGVNNSPIRKDLYCVNCGNHPEINKLQSKLKEALSIIEESLPIMRDKYIRNQWFERIEKLKKELG